MDTQKKHWNVKPVLEALVVMCKFIIGNQPAEYVTQKNIDRKILKDQSCNFLLVTCVIFIRY